MCTRYVIGYAGTSKLPVDFIKSPWLTTWQKHCRRGLWSVKAPGRGLGASRRGLCARGGLGGCLVQHLVIHLVTTTPLTTPNHRRCKALEFAPILLMNSYPCCFTNETSPISTEFPIRPQCSTMSSKQCNVFVALKSHGSLDECPTADCTLTQLRVSLATLHPPRQTDS